MPIAVSFRVYTVSLHDALPIFDSLVLLELKAARALDPSHEAQLLLYGRPPLAEEERIGLDFLARAGLGEDGRDERRHSRLLANEFIYVDLKDKDERRSVDEKAM